MRLGQFYMLVGTSFLAPHLSSTAGLCAAAVYMAIGLCLRFYGKDLA